MMDEEIAGEKLKSAEKLRDRKSPTVVFRADANNQIASGHVMRCLSIAEACTNIGMRPVFACADGRAEDLIMPKGFKVECLNSDWRHPEREVGIMRRLLSSLDASVLLVDNPRIDRCYVEQLCDSCPVWFLGSDRIELGPLDGVISYSASIDKSWYERVYSSYGTKRLLGLEYAPLRNEFAEGLMRTVPRRETCCRRALLTMGGSDSGNFTARVLRAIAPIAEARNITVEVIVGGMFTHTQALEDEFGSAGNIVLRRGVTKMADLMNSSDIAISANGTTVYELLACGLPVILFSMNSEQRRDAASFQELGVATYCGCLDDGPSGCAERIARAFDLLLDDHALRESLSLEGTRLVDGKGAARIAAELREAALNGKCANMEEGFPCR